MILKIGNPIPAPGQRVRWPGYGAPVQIQQVKTASQPSQTANGLPPAPVKTINQPAPVMNVRVTRRTIGSDRQITVTFVRDPADQFFQKVNVHLVQGSNPPRYVTSGTESPITFTLPASSAPSVIKLQAEGNWGAHPIENSPSKSFSLL